jgi:hypothetical protein
LVALAIVSYDFFMLRSEAAKAIEPILVFSGSADKVNGERERCSD